MIHNPYKNGVMMVAISGVRPDTHFWDKLQKDECKSLVEFYRCADKIIRLETTREAIQVGKPTPAEKINDNGKKQKNRDRRPSPKKTNKKPKAPDQRVPQPLSGKFTNYTDLVSSRKDIFMVAERKGVFKRPDPLCGDHSKRNQNKYCWFHKDVGHTTEECITLKDEIEKFIHRRYLQDYINNKRARPQNDGPKAEPPRKIWTFFSRPHFARKMRGVQERYV